MAIPKPDKNTPLLEADPKTCGQAWFDFFGYVDAQIKSFAASIASFTTSIATLVSIWGSSITSSLGADVALNNTGNYFDGPSIAQGSTGTWFVSGSVTVQDTAGAARINAKLWDGTTVIASAQTNTAGATASGTISLSGFKTSPAGNLRISCQDATSTNGKITFNQSGNSKDATITAFRVA